jgi:hypothetical protein
MTDLQLWIIMFGCISVGTLFGITIGVNLKDELVDED